MTADAGLRLAIFLGLFVLLAALERRRPVRQLSLPRRPRWLTNLAMAALDAALVRLLFGAAAAGAALDAAMHGWGLFARVDWPGWLEGMAGFLALDFAIWLQHLLMHKVPLLWRLHRVHHADRDVDVTTGVRFHPVEIALSMAFKIGLIYALGIPFAAVVAFEVVLNGMAMFNHANLRLGRRLDAVLRLVLVTPDMHRVHHSVERDEHNANFGFNLSIWDRAFRTYVAAPRGGHQGMRLGLPEYQDERPARLDWSLLLPFARR